MSEAARCNCIVARHNGWEFLQNEVSLDCERRQHTFQVSYSDLFFQDVCIEGFVAQLGPALNFFTVLKASAVRKHLFKKLLRDRALQIDKCCQSFSYSDSFGGVDRERRVWLLALEVLVLTPLKLSLDVQSKLFSKLDHILCSVLRIDGEVRCSLVGQSRSLKVQDYLKSGTLIGLLAKLSDGFDFDVRA